jgi:hypothetical protein
MNKEHKKTPKSIGILLAIAVVVVVVSAFLTVFAGTPETNAWFTYSITGSTVANAE